MLKQKFLTNFMSVALATLALMGCKEVTIKDGRIPKEYLTQAKQLEGRYYGEMDGNEAVIDITFDGDRPILKYSDRHGNDILGNNCNSRVDHLKKVILYKKSGKYVVDQAIFGFHPGHCRQVQGRTLELNFSGTRKFVASIYDYSDYRHRCDMGPPPNYGNQCRMEEVPHFINGRFSRR
jgi:hypothetical protein